MHHPFTSPVEADMDRARGRTPAGCSGQAYDLVLNGSEIGGGSIRIHDTALQRRMFKLLGLSDEERETAVRLLPRVARATATPPHGGIALGFDRLVMLLAGEESIREVIAFPEDDRAPGPHDDGSPSPVDARQLDGPGLKLR
ncbi:MAG: hypothetical protein MZV49_00005 [Rhodopseudomonas palustris]|nr:hypothetical protein [Rhodopseudomonas palustris]